MTIAYPPSSRAGRRICSSLWRAGSASGAARTSYTVPAAQSTKTSVDETLEWLAPRPGQTLVDATLGLGGHAAAILEQLGPEGTVLGIDRDPVALALAKRRLADAPAPP